MYMYVYVCACVLVVTITSPTSRTLYTNQASGALTFTTGNNVGAGGITISIAALGGGSMCGLLVGSPVTCPAFGTSCSSFTIAGGTSAGSCSLSYTVGGTDANHFISPLSTTITVISTG